MFYYIQKPNENYVRFGNKPFFWADYFLWTSSQIKLNEEFVQLSETIAAVNNWFSDPVRANLNFTNQWINLVRLKMSQEPGVIRSRSSELEYADS